MLQYLNLVLAPVDCKCVFAARELRYQSGGHYDHCVVVCDGVHSGERRDVSGKLHVITFHKMLILKRVS